jgi:hypothetical protein
MWTVGSAAARTTAWPVDQSTGARTIIAGRGPPTSGRTARSATSSPPRRGCGRPYAGCSAARGDRVEPAVLLPAARARGDVVHRRSLAAAVPRRWPSRFITPCLDQAGPELYRHFVTTYWTRRTTRGIGQTPRRISGSLRAPPPPADTASGWHVAGPPGAAARGQR